MKNLSQRQESERQYHEEWLKQTPLPETITFDPVLGHERRPWNSYWAAVRPVVDFYKGNEEQRLLDLGCGCGVWSIRYARIGYRVDGIDVCESLIRHAGKLAGKYGYEGRMAFSVQAAEALCFEDESFDVVVGMDILHHVEVKPVINEVWRVLRKGGLAVFRECTEAFILERIRHTWLVENVICSEPSFERYITPHERPLSKSDLKEIRDRFSDSHVQRFDLLSRLGVVVPVLKSSLQKVDYYLLRAVPFLKAFGSGAVLVLRK